MHLTLLLRGLLDTASILEGPQLAKLLAGAPLHREPEGAPAVLAPLYGVARQQDWPLAPLRAAARGIAPGDAYWLAATPVCLVAGRDDVRIGQVVRDLDAADARVLTTALDRHFADDGLSFIAAEPARWFARLERAPSIATRPLSPALGHPLREHLATGADAAVWRRWEQEIQMLLHAHAVNSARERQRRTPVNGLWFEEGGQMPASGGLVDIATWGEDEYLRALAHHVGAPARSVPPDFAAMENARSAAHHVVDLGGGVAGDAAATAFLHSVHAALQAGRLSAVTVLADGPGRAAAVWTTARPKLMARLFPPRTPPLREILAAAREEV